MAMRRAIFISDSFSDGALIHPMRLLPPLGGPAATISRHLVGGQQGVDATAKDVGLGQGLQSPG